MPQPAHKWSFESAAHLLNRAGFGGTTEEIEATHAAGLQAAVYNLLHPPNEPGNEGTHPWTVPEDVQARM
ncbi:MAG TPA: hypothetical protein VNW28_10100, partial [Chthoniobacterales bacterium]|nr:hypothetical protein [Chthoniobacterales bacterium]